MTTLLISLTLLGISIPGVVIAVPFTTRKSVAILEGRLPEGKSLPPLQVLTAVQIAQSLVLVAGMSVLGAVLAPKTGLEAPLFSALIRGDRIMQTVPDPIEVLGLSAAGSVIFMLLYYLVFRPWMGSESAAAMDRYRNQLGMGARILYGGVVEEVLMRWGIMNLLVWLFGLVLPSTASVLAAIVVAGVIFGLGHIPAYRSAGCAPGAPLYTTQIVLNLWAGLFFGYLFWRYGLLAAIASHMLFHLFWYPVDRAMLRRFSVTLEARNPEAEV